MSYRKSTPLFYHVEKTVMKVTLREYGGPIDPTGRRAQVVDTGSLPTAKADELVNLIAQAKIQPPVPDPNGEKGGDIMTYKITVEENGQSVVLRQSDTTQTQAFVDLQNWIKLNGVRT